MFSKIEVAASVAFLAVALPQVPQTNTLTGFGLIAIHSGDPKIHMREVTANDYGLSLGKPTTSYCPSDAIDCTPYPGNVTALAAQTVTGTAHLDVVIPGGQ